MNIANKIRVACSLAAIGLALCINCGCSSWEQVTFNTLAVNQGVLDTLHADYDAGKLPKTACVHDLITNAIAIDTAADTAFKLYAVHKLAGLDVQGEQNAIALDLVDVAGMVAQLKNLNTAPCGGK